MHSNPVSSAERKWRLVARRSLSDRMSQLVNTQNRLHLEFKFTISLGPQSDGLIGRAGRHNRAFGEK